MFDKIPYRYLRWVLSGVLIVAGLLKILEPENLIEVLLFFDLFSEGNAYRFSILIGVIEISLAIAFIVKFKFSAVKVIVCLLFSLFLVISIVGYLDNWQFACGCLGRFSFGKFDLMMVSRNSILTIMSGLVLMEKGFKEHPSRDTSTIKKEV